MKNFSALVLASVLGSIVTIGSYELLDRDDSKSVKVEHVDNTPVMNAAYSVNEAGDLVPLDFTSAAEKVMPAVVHIRSTQVGNYASRNDQVPEQFRDFFGPFFRDDRGQRGPRVGSGSGVIINNEGYIVTNNHVIDGADELEVTLNDNRSYKAKVIGTDPTTDLAVIQIKEKGLSHLSLVNSDNVRVGEWVLAVGNPFNLNSTVTAGIVSAKGRSINIINPDRRDSLNTAIESFIQTDAAVNPGNSGGALVNLNGDLIGINTAIASPTGSYSGYAFAVPANIVSRVVEDLISYGMVQRGWLGVTINSVNSTLAREFDLEVNSGALVRGIAGNSGAKEAGIKDGDVIVKIDDIEVENTAQLIGYVGSKRPGDVVTIKVNRQGKDIDFNVTLKNRDGNTEIVERAPENVFNVLGADLEDLDSRTLKRLDISSGVRVKSIGPGQIKKHTDMQEGFIITRIDGESVNSKEEVMKILENKEGGILLEGVYEGQSGKYYYGLGM
ncbi:Do family serine endopeptidase [Fulvivirga sp. M361]|uniref:Do family serine endopeptidase n=1 Tax=Fulvivirga sp. M361 TaxID=2594266 RepID=UPI00117BCD04|nr:Do family serine endopeptidase [Fulvivirga sp. M361]TRX45295.1 Do family serine endopeptidase [Fulvivirga sp. M361]